LTPEEIASKIQQFDNELCTQLFLSELKRVLPSPEQVGKLNVYVNAEPEELAGLHPADRLMVKLIQIKRLGPRIEGMLYKCGFSETWLLLDDVGFVFVIIVWSLIHWLQAAKKLADAGRALLDAKSFKELLSVSLGKLIWLPAVLASFSSSF
jgi:cytokinesis protein